MTLATNDEEIVDAEVVEDFNVDDVFKPRPVHEVEVYAGPDDTVARTNLRQAGEIERGNRWSIARLIACSVEIRSHGGDRRSDQVPDRYLKLGWKEAKSILRMGQDTIKNYLAAWDGAARDGLCAPSSDLSPGDGWTTPMPDPDEWATYKTRYSKSAKTEPTASERDWPEVPEPDDYTGPTPEEKVQRFEETRQRLIDQGLIPRPRTQEEDDAAAERFVQSLTGKTPPRTRAPETPETKLKTLLNEISKLLTEGATLDNLDGLTEAGREAYAKLTKEI